MRNIKDFEGVVVLTEDDRKENKYDVFEAQLVLGSDRDFHEGLVAVANTRCRRDFYESYWGFIDKTGKIVIPTIYKKVGDFSEGLALVVNKNKKYGFIDKTGEVVIPLEYDCVGDFHEGLARAEKHNNYDGWHTADDFYYLDKNNKRLSLDTIITDDDNVLTLLEKGDCIRNVKTRYVLEYQGELMLFDSKEEREEYIKSLDESINMSPDYCNEESKKYQKVLK